MKYDSVKKEKQPAASKASKTLKTDIKVHKGNRNENEMKKHHIRKNLKLPNNSGVIYIGHIPHGFYEDEMKSYFNQFGKVTETAVARSKKTGRSKGFGFVQFADKEVAKIAAETMNNYLMFNRVIKCRYIPPEERNTRVVQGKINTSNYPRQKNRIITVQNNKKALENLDQTTYLKKVKNKVNQFKKFFEENGIDFTYNFNNEGPKPQKNTPVTKKTKKTSNNPEAEIKEEMENQFGVLEIDESDSEISFRTPPQVKKVIKKSLNSPAKVSKKSALSKKIQTKKEIKMNQIKNKRLKKIQEKEKGIKKSESKLSNIREKLDREVKRKVKLAKPVTSKASSKRDINTVIKQKNLKINKSIGIKESKKGCGVQARMIKEKKASKKIKASIKNQSSCFSDLCINKTKLVL